MDEPKPIRLHDYAIRDGHAVPIFKVKIVQRGKQWGIWERDVISEKKEVTPK